MLAAASLLAVPGCIKPTFNLTFHVAEDATHLVGVTVGGADDDASDDDAKRRIENAFKLR